MSKNTNTSGFRKIDIDAFDPENYKDDDDSSNQIEERGPNEQEITTLLNSKKNVDALKAVLNNPPLNTKNQNTKVNYF